MSKVPEDSALRIKDQKIEVVYLLESWESKILIPNDELPKDELPKDEHIRQAQ